METLRSLSPAKSILLAAQFSAQANIDNLRSLTAVHPNVLVHELVLRILLTFLPEITQPKDYTSFLKELLTGVPEPSQHHNVDCSSIDQISEEKARRSVKKLHLLRLQHPSIHVDATSIDNDSLVLFLIHRAHLIEQRSGQIQLIEQLVTPFLDRSEYLRIWYISAVIPLIRYNDGYYVQEQTNVLPLETIESVQGDDGVSMLMTKSREASKDGRATSKSVGRDLRGLVGPWTYGAYQRKRRKLDKSQVLQRNIAEEVNGGFENTLLEEWHHTLNWLVNSAASDFSLAVKAVDGWDGPNDVDLNEHDGYLQSLLPKNAHKDQQRLNYCQTAFACIYAAEDESTEAVQGAYSILMRLADLLDFEPPPGLTVSPHLLPRIEKRKDTLEDIPRSSLSIEFFLDPNHPLTTPDLQSYNLLQMFVYSAYMLRSLGHPLSVCRVAKFRFWSDAVEQLSLVKQILRSAESGARRGDDQIGQIREGLLWLHDWNIPRSQRGENENGYGVIGNVSRWTLEKEILGSMCSTSVRTELIKATYIDRPPSEQPLPLRMLEDTLITIALNYYDNASNGNRTRGGVKKAFDIVNAFRPSFPESVGFKRVAALISATHALSFYTLTLQKGIPFQPVSIRVTEDPTALIEKVLAQNPGSYAKLNDLVDIARNLALSASLDNPNNTTSASHDPNDSEGQRLQSAERRVFLMTINAALSEGDFETAYSYVINHLSRANASSTEDTDDMSWRAADAAGRYRPATPIADPTKALRRLEQRMELLSKAVSLAPPQHMVEAVSAWRRAEEEWKALQDREHAEAESFDSRSDAVAASARGTPFHGGSAARGGTGMPGSFAGGTADGDVYVQEQPRRKELGRGATEEAPMGLFDVASNAAAAFSRTYGKARGGARSKGSANTVVSRSSHKPAQTLQASPSIEEDNGGEDWAWGAEGDGRSEDEEEESELRTSLDADRVRKRDIVANAVTGRLASGIGWVLGATPVREGSGGD